MSSSRKRRAAEPAEYERQRRWNISTNHLSVSPLRSSLWSELPNALFDRVCSYVGEPVLEQLLVLSAVSRCWSQLLDGDASGRYNCWRHVPACFLSAVGDGVRVRWSFGAVGRQAKYTAPMLRALCRLPSLSVTLRQCCSLSGHIRLLDQLCLPPAASSSSTPNSSSGSIAGRSSSSRVMLSHLAIQSWFGIQPTGRSLQPPRARDIVQLSAALSRFLLRCPPLRSMVLRTWGCIPSTAALRHLYRGARLAHLEVEPAALSALVWADRLEPTRPWKATTVESVVLCTYLSRVS